MYLAAQIPKVEVKERRRSYYWWSPLWSFFSITLWGALPARIQRAISKCYASFYNTSFSKHLIAPYSWWHYSNPEYLEQFVPPNGKSTYQNFQDFFTRQFRILPTVSSRHVWPCEGILCHSGRVDIIPTSNVKGDIRKVHDIFGLKESDIPVSNYFSNVFLHNKNYHRIHAPVDGVVTRIQHIPEDLVILRPWIYKDNPSTPAFRNERINVDIRDDQNRIWFLSIIGGPAVGSILLNEKIAENRSIQVMDEIASFQLGSTCCMIAPFPTNLAAYRSEIYVGDCYS